jgi:hypothetical protein
MKTPPVIEVLDEKDEVPPLHDVTPGWVTRNREAIETASRVGRSLMLVAPPPARIALGAASVAVDAVLLATDVRRRNREAGDGALEGAALALEGAALLAVSRFAPARLAAGLAGIETARRAVERIRGTL